MTFAVQPPPGVPADVITTRPQPAVQATNLVKHFGNCSAVRGVNFSVARGECFGLLGPNGAGKTSIVKMIYGFSPVTSGSLMVLGNDISVKARQVKAKIGVVAQDDNLDPELTVRDNLLVYAGYFRLPKNIARERTDEILEFMDLTDKSDEIVENLSGGMRRRLTIGRALINRPELLILDEPTTGLDPYARRLVWQRLRKLKETGTTMLLTTHYLEEASQLCDRLLVLHHGQIMEEGTPPALIERHVGQQALEIGTVVNVPGSPFDIQNFSPEIYNLLKTSQDLGDNLILFTDHGQELSDRINGWANAHGVHITYQRLRPTNLEDVFLRLTGETLAEETGSNYSQSGGHRNAVQARHPSMPAMRRLNLSGPLIWRVFLRNLRVFAKTWKANIMFNFLEPMLYLWAMGFGLGVYVSRINGLSYIQFLGPGLIASSAMFATTYEMTYGSFTRMSQQKVFHGMVATPVSMDDVIMGEILYGTFKGILYGSVFFLVVALFGLVKSPWSLLIPIPLALMTVIFSTLSLIWTSIAPNYDSFGYFFTLFISPMFLFAGIFFPIDNLPAAVRFLPWLTPLYHAVEVIRPLVLGLTIPGISTDLAWLVIATGLTIWIPLVMLKRRLIK